MRALLWLAVFESLGILVLVWGLPRARRHMFPWKWRFGVVALGLSLIVWPPLWARYADSTNGIGQMVQADRIQLL